MKQTVALLGLVLLICGADKGARGDARRQAVPSRGPKAASQPATEAHPVVPPIGHLLGIHVGGDSIEKLEKLHGRGQACVGDSPRGGRVWKNACWLVYANGKDAGPAGTVITEIVMGDPGELAFPVESKTSKALPKLTGKTKPIFAGLYPGISRAEATKLLAGRKWKASPDGDDLVLRMGGLSKVGKDGTFSDWEARLAFRKDRLVQVAVRCWQEK